MARIGRSFPIPGPLRPAVSHATTVSPAGASIVGSGAAPTLTTALIPAGASVSITGATPSVSITSPSDIIPTGASISVTGGTPLIPASLMPSGASVAVTGGTPIAVLSLTPAAASVSVSVSAPTLAMALKPSGATVSLTGGTPLLPGPPVAYDATGAGQTGGGATSTSLSFSHTAASGADVFLSILVDRQVTPTSVTYAGSSMTLVGSKSANNDSVNGGIVYLYHIASVASGAHTVSASIPSCWWVANCVSYTGVASVGAAQYAYGSSTSPSSGSQSCPLGQMVLSVIGAGYSTTATTLSAATGGTNRYLANNASSAATAGLSISDSTSPGATFGATLSGASKWASVGVLLSSGSTVSTLTPAGASITVTGSAPALTIVPLNTYVPDGATVSITGGTPIAAVTKPPVHYDAIGPGQAGGGAGSTSISFSHTAAAGADVFLSILVDRQATPSSVTYGGTSMTLVGSKSCNNDSVNGGVIYLYRIAGVSGGAATASASIGTACWWIANTVSYTGVAAVSSLISTYGSSASPSETISSWSSGQMVLSVIGAGYSTTATTLSSATGGTNRYLGNNGSATGATGLAISDSTSPAPLGGSTTSFGATLSHANEWTAGGVVLTGGTLELVPSAASVIGVAGSSPLIPLLLSNPDPPNLVVAGGTPGVLILDNHTVVPNGATITFSGSLALTARGLCPPGGAVAATGNTPLPISIDVAGPFRSVINKLNSGQSATIQTLGDSTVAGMWEGTPVLNGWAGRLAVLLGQYYNVNVVVKDYATNYTTVTGTYSAGTTYYASTLGPSAPTLLLLNGGVGGAFLSNQSSWLSTILPVANPDVIVIGQGFNDLISGMSTSTFTTTYQSWVNSISTTYCPNVPIVVTTENPSTGTYPTSAFTPGFSALTTAYVGSGVPLSPVLQQSASNPLMWVLDTRQSFTANSTNNNQSDGVGGLHPSGAGYAAEAAWMQSWVAPMTVGSPYPPAAAITVTGGTPAVGLYPTIFIKGSAPSIAGVTFSLAPLSAIIPMPGSPPVVYVKEGSHGWYGGKITVYEFRGTDPTGSPAPTNDWFAQNIDSSRFTWINVNYPAAVLPMGVSVKTGVQMGIDLINKTPGRFCLVGTSQGAIVASDLYDEIRHGSLQSRRGDLLAGCMFVNPRRESKKSFPNCFEPGGRGIYDPNLYASEPLWWEFPIPGDPASSWPDDGSELSVWGRAVMTDFINTFTGSINSLLQRFPNLLVDVLEIIQSILQILYGLTHAHQIADIYQPLLTTTGDPRTCFQITIDYLESRVVADANVTATGTAMAVSSGGVIPATTEAPHPANTLSLTLPFTFAQAASYAAYFCDATARATVDPFPGQRVYFDPSLPYPVLPKFFTKAYSPN